MKKRVMALALVLALCLCVFSGCGNGEMKAVCGTWVAEVDLAAKVQSLFAEACPDMVGSVSITSFPAKLELVLLDNGTYQLSLEGETFQNSMRELELTLENCLRSFLEQEFANIISGGLSLEDVLAAAGSSMEIQMEDAYGTFLTDLPAALAGRVEVDGKFRVGDGQLYMSQQLDLEVSDRVFHMYEVTKTELKLTSGYFTELSYPLLFTKQGK